MSHYLAIDVEASGPSYRDNFIPCFGAAIVSVEQQRIVSKFEAYMSQPSNKTWNPACRQHFWETQNQSVLTRWESREATLETPEATMSRFVDWAQAQKMLYPDLLIVTDTAGFDAGWLNYYLSHYYVATSTTAVESLNYIFGQYQPIRDLSSFHMGIARITPVRGLTGAEKSARDVLGLDQPSFAHLGQEHDPARDAAVIGLEAAQIAQEIERTNQMANWSRFFRDEVEDLADWSQEHWDRSFQALCFRVDQVVNFFSFCQQN